MWEKSIDIHEVKLLRTRSNVYFGVGAIDKISDVVVDLKSKGVNSVLIVSGRAAYKSCGAWDKIEAALTANQVKYAIYDKVTPNPTCESIDEAADLGREAQVQAVIAIGGGSPIDAGKSAAALIPTAGATAEQLYCGEFAPATALPIVAVNLTHGTGTETNRFAVATVTEKEYKPAIAYDVIYPTWSIDDPALMTGLSPKQTIYVSVDAINHVVEAATSKEASPFTVLLAQETIRLVVNYLPAAMKDPNDLEARYFLAYAAMLGGMCFDNGLLHFTHALEHPLSGVRPELTHGLGLSILLPAVVENTYAAKGKVFADILSPMVPGLTGAADEAYKAAKGVETWLQSVDVPEKLSDVGFSEADIPRLLELSFETPSLGLLLSMAPVEATPELVEKIFRSSLKVMA